MMYRLTNRTTLVLFLLLSSLLIVDASVARGDEPSGIEAELQKATRRAAGSQTFDLRYKFKPGEQVRTEVTHLVTVETKIGGVTEKAETKSVSVKHWKVLECDDNGCATFVHSVESVNMWQRLTGRQEIRYDSNSSEEPPAEYEQVAESVGKPLATITMDAHGKILNRVGNQPQFNPGIGELTIPLPGRPVPIGQTWHSTDEVRVRLEDRQVRRIKTRQLYELEKVEAGVATISLKTQVITPVDDPKVMAQLVQRLKDGEIRFDMDAGRVISTRMDLDETVINFSGADSIMQYLARFDEQLLADKKVASKPSKD